MKSGLVVKLTFGLLSCFRRSSRSLFLFNVSWSKFLGFGLAEEDPSLNPALVPGLFRFAWMLFSALGV